MNIVTIIPARYASTRFPGKPLIDIEGKSMIQRVYEQAKQARQISEVVVATDDQRIVDHLTSLNIPYVMTDASHQSGTDRCAEAAMHIKADAVINLQGDEPFIDPGQIDAIAQLLNEGARIATLVKPITISEELFNPNKPKVVLSSGGQALYFSRSAIPHLRNIPEQDWVNHHTYFKHIGIYGYDKGTLQRLSKLGISSLEQAECLEQLRWMENGFSITCAITNQESYSIDTPEDYRNLALRR